MAQSFSVSFDINGKLDGSLVAALSTAAQKMKSLGDTAKVLNGKSVKLGQTLNNAQAQLKNIEAYKALQAAIKDNIQAQMQERAKSAQLLRQRNQEQRKLDDMRQSYQQLQKVYRQSRKSMGADAAAVMKSQMQQARAEIKAQEKQIRDVDKSYNQSQQRQQSLQTQLPQHQQQASKLRTSVPAGNLAASEASLRAQIDQTTAALNREIEAINRRNQAQAQASQASQKLSEATGNFQGAMGTAESIVSPFKSAVENAMTFEHSMSKVKALTQTQNIREGNFAQVEADMAKLEGQARELGATTQFTMSQAADAMGYLG